MKDVINPAALSITGDVEENRLTSGQLRLGALKVWGSGHWGVLCGDVVSIGHLGALWGLGGHLDKCPIKSA